MNNKKQVKSLLLNMRNWAYNSYSCCSVSKVRHFHAIPSSTFTFIVSHFASPAVLKVLFHDTALDQNCQNL